MREVGQEPLGPFALYISRPTWICGEPKPNDLATVAWKGLGIHDVPITALRDGMIIFEFDKSDAYKGGEVPDYTLPENRRIPQHVTKADKDRVELGYQRFEYMNAFLFALYSGISTVQKKATFSQDPVDPTNYFGAERSGENWKTFMDYGRKIDYPRNRSDNIEVETLDHSLEILQKFYSVISGPSLNILSLVYISSAQYTHHQFPSAHLIAWTAIEALLNFM